MNKSFILSFRGTVVNRTCYSWNRTCVYSRLKQERIKFRETNRKEFWLDNGLKEGTGIKISCK